MTLPPQVNGTLLAVFKEGFAKNYRNLGGPAQPVWEGASGMFFAYKEKSVFNERGEFLNRVRIPTAYIDGELCSLELGYQITYSYQDVQYTATIQNLSTDTLPGVPTYSVLELEQINAT